jgi:hypothetical protein
LVVLQYSLQTPAQRNDMSRTVLAAFMAVSAISVAQYAGAQTSSSEADDARYSYHRVDDGFLRLDLRGGGVSLCHHHAFGWSCEVLPEERGAFEQQIARLRSENAALKRSLLDHGLSLPSGTDSSGTSGQDMTIKSASSADIEGVKAMVGKVWRQLVELIMNFQKDVMKKT